MSNLNVKLLKNVESKTKIYLAIIAIILIALCINNIAYIIPSIIGYALIIVYTIWVYKRRKSEISNYITDLTINVDSAAKNTLINSPFPIIILETDGNVIWRSSKFNKEFANVGINSYIDDIAKEIKMDIENQDTTQIDKQISIEDKIYHVIGNFVKIKQKNTKKTSKYMTILYFVDVTEKQEILKKYEQSKLCVGIIMVDNYEEVIQRVQPEETPQIMAKIEKELYDWANDVQGIMIKKESDTFVFIFEQKFLDKMKEEKFAILDKIKEIRNEENLQMWAHYANNHQGYCIKYKIDNKKAFFKIMYEDNRIPTLSIPLNLYKKKKKSDKQKSETKLLEKYRYLFILLLNIKHSSWSNEKEYRLICSKEKDGGSNLNNEIVGIKPVEMYLGLKCSDKNKSILKSIAENNLNCKCYESLISNTKILDFKEL